MSTDTVTQTVHVAGMTCGHCVQAVTDEVVSIEGVRTVRVDLDSGAVTVESSALAAAVDEAGYEVVR